MQIERKGVIFSDIGEILLLYYFMFINKHDSTQQQNLPIKRPWLYMSEPAIFNFWNFQVYKITIVTAS